MIDESSQPRSPMKELPTEILCEIFARCVDLTSAHVLMQPNTQIAPMSLCHVCATWRAIVLATPSFWSHLRFELPLDWHANGRPYTEHPELLVRRVEWLRWWRRNLGAMAPFLQVELRQMRQKDGKYRQGRLSEPAAEFLLELLSSAQYIRVGRLYRYLVQRHQEAGYVVAMHPMAHTVVATWTSVVDFGGLLSYIQYLQAVVTQTKPTTLRCIAIENAKLAPHDFTRPPNYWSILTHLSTLTTIIPLYTWFRFIRSLSGLQSGSFLLNFLDRDIAHYPRPSTATLPCLTVLHIDAAQHMKDSVQYPLRAAFAHLQLPALRTLSLNSRARTWYGATALDDVEAALLSAPAVTELTLGPYFLRGKGHPADTAFFKPTRGPVAQGPATPLARCAPRLERLRLTMASPLEQEEWRPFVDRVFASGVWLDLKRPASTVREVTFVASATSRPVDMVVEHAERSLLMAEVREFVGDEVVVGFEDEGPVEAQRVVWDW